MKKCSTLIGTLILTFSLSFVWAASGAKAEMTQDSSNNLVATLKLKATSLMKLSNASSGETVRGSKSLKEARVTLNQELDAFLDFSSPHPQEIRTKNSRSDMRAVLGLHFMLR